MYRQKIDKNVNTRTSSFVNYSSSKPVESVKDAAADENGQALVGEGRNKYETYFVYGYQ